jgi:hypothetical protein
MRNASGGGSIGGSVGQPASASEPTSGPINVSEGKDRDIRRRYRTRGRIAPLAHARPLAERGALARWMFALGRVDDGIRLLESTIAECPRRDPQLQPVRGGVPVERHAGIVRQLGDLLTAGVGVKPDFTTVGVEAS